MAAGDWRAAAAKYKGGGDAAPLCSQRSWVGTYFAGLAFLYLLPGVGDYRARLMFFFCAGGEGGFFGW